MADTPKTSVEKEAEIAAVALLGRGQIGACDPGGTIYSVMAKIAYMNKSKAPINHADRPPLVMKQVVTVAIMTMVTAPGQNCKSIGFGPTA